ncbi:MAG: dephospho-CoA kinase [Mariniphaga sp.]
MKKVGITGGIGSGKTTVCEIFRLLGVPVFHADDEARYLQNNDISIRNQLVGLLGADIYLSSGLLDRKKLASLIFNNQELLANVNQIIHPAVRQRFIKWSLEYTNEPYVLYEAAILLESGYSLDFEINVLILADENARIERVTRRDRISGDLVRERIRNQMPDSQKINLVDYIIENNNRQLLIPQIIELDKEIREKYSLSSTIVLT